MNRRTSIYQLTIPIEDATAGQILDTYIELIDQEPDCERSGAGFTPMGEPRVMYRATGDDMAIQIGRMVDAPQGSTIHTGLGVHRRLVKEF
jgi:hypothetical protein